MIIELLFSFFICIINCVTIGPEGEDNRPELYCGSKNLIFYNHTPFYYISNDEKICSGQLFLLNYVQSSSYNFARRMTIRQTWGSLRYVGGVSVKLLFIIGRPHDSKTQKNIEKEIKEYRDVIQADFIDSYSNLTLKHIVALHWIYKFCSQSKFITKSDDDVLINIFVLVAYLKEKLNPNEKYVVGPISYHEYPLRYKNKWFVSNETYPFNEYPPYIKGILYVMTQATIKPLFVCSFYQKFLFIDDIFITGLVVKLANITLLDFEAQSSIWLTKENITISMIDNLFFVSQAKYDPQQWKDIWRMVLETEL